MSKLIRILKMVGILAGIVAVGVAVGWLGTRGSKQPGSPAPVADAPGVARGHSPAPENPAPPIINPHPRVVPPAVEPMPSAQVAANVMTNWEDKLDEVLGGEGDEADKARRLLEMFPHLPEEGQVEVAQHLSNLTADKDYAPLGAYLTNSATPEQVLDVLMGDVLNRPNSLKLPTLLEVAREPQHPKASEAKDILELFLEEDFGADWNAWQSKMQQWLADNPD